MGNTPIESIMTTTMENLKEMVDVNTVVGEPINAADGATIIPISRVCVGYVAGGGEYGCAKDKQAPQGAQAAPGTMPFAGGSGAGVTVQPMGFLIVKDEHTRLVPAQYYAPLDRVIELAPQVLCEMKRALERMCDKKAEKQANEAPSATP